MKLEDIKKKNIYTVPDKYFDQLPRRIQSRIAEKKPVPGPSLDWNLALKVAVPAFAAVLLLFYFAISTNKTILSAEEILAQVSTEDLITYLETTDVTTDEIIEELDLTNIDLDPYDGSSIMPDLKIDDEEIEALLDEYGIDDELL